MDDDERKKKIAQLLRDADWEALHRATRKYAEAHLRGHFKERAGDVAQAVIAIVLTPGHDWDVEAVPTLEEHLRILVNTHAWNMARNAVESRRAEDGEGALAQAASNEPSPESTANDRELLELARAALVAEFGERGGAYLRLIVDADASPEQAKSMGVTKEDLSRIKYTAREFCRAALAQQREDARRLAAKEPPLAALEPIAPEAAAEIAAFLEQHLHAPARRKARIYVTRTLFVASVTTLAIIAVWYFRFR
jgi:hypothetical protein